jgi:hypothetical protein
MPRRTVTRCSRRDVAGEQLHPNVEEQLLTGEGFWESPLETDEDFAEAWAKWGEYIVARMRDNYPGRKIYACSRLRLPQPLIGS